MEREILALLERRGCLQRHEIVNAIGASPAEVSRKLRTLFRKGHASFRPGFGWIALMAGRAALRARAEGEKS